MRSPETKALLAEFLFEQGWGPLTLRELKQIALVSNAQIIMSGNTVSASQVTISYPFSFMLLNGAMQLIVRGSTVGKPITMTASALMRNEAP